MFGKNEIVGRSFFRDAPANSLFVTSLFFTIQGEGPFRGEPAFFVRLAKCNLNCSFCDTFFDQGQWMTYEEIDFAIEMALGNYFKDTIPQWIDGDTNYTGRGELAPTWTEPRKMVLVVTGGEPGLQKDNLRGFFTYFAPQFQNIQVETNGMFEITANSKVTIVASPKCNVVGRYIPPCKALLDKADCLKFVMSAERDSSYHTIPDWALTWAKVFDRPIFVSPMTIYNDLPKKAKELRINNKEESTLEQRSTVDEVISFWEPGLLNQAECKANHEYTAKYALQHGLIFNMQMHLFASMA